MTTIWVKFIIEARISTTQAPAHKHTILISRLFTGTHFLCSLSLYISPLANQLHNLFGVLNVCQQVGTFLLSPIVIYHSHTLISISLGKPSTQLLQSIIWLPVGRYIPIISHCHLSVLVTSLFPDKLSAISIAVIMYFTEHYVVFSSKASGHYCDLWSTEQMEYCTILTTCSVTVTC